MKESILYKIVRPIIKFLFTCLYTPKISNKENIPNEGKCILAGTHTNNFDCLLLISCTKRCIHFLAKKELWEGPKKIIFNNLGLIPVDRQRKDHNSIVCAEEYLNNQKLIGIFPEGTIEKEKNKLLPFKIGALKMAYDTKAPIIPFAISGDYKFFSRNLKVTFGKPFYINSDDLEKERERLISEIIKLKGGA